VSTEKENTNTQPGEAKATEQTPSVQKAAVTGKALDWKLLGRVMHYVKPYNTTFIIAVFLTIFLAGVAIIQPILIQKTMDDYILKNNYSGLVFMVELMITQLIVQPSPNIIKRSSPTGSANPLSAICVSISSTTSPASA